MIVSVIFDIIVHVVTIVIIGHPSVVRSLVAIIVHVNAVPIRQRRSFVTIWKQAPSLRHSAASLVVCSATLFYEFCMVPSVGNPWYGLRSQFSAH